ncbi:helix-turn-helix transcriptional regulator [Clostridium phoceensis]|nr:helix-turn-helix transcriptional regulator [Clostridium phoceensis]
MARFLECTDRNYQKMEYGEINVPGLTLIKLADFFQVSLDYLVGRSDDREQ